MSKANEKQIGGNHYKSSIQHWDYVVANDLDYFQAQITKYVTRWKKKAGIPDLEKALHFLEKYMEIEKGKAAIENRIDKIPLVPSLKDLLSVERQEKHIKTTVLDPHKQYGQEHPYGYDKNRE